MAIFPSRLRTFILRHKAETFLFTAFVIVSAVLSLYHEPWRDEAQAWLYVRDQSFMDILGNLNIEGHPALWFLLLFPFVKLGLPYESIFVLHFCLAMACGALLLFRSPFKMPVKALLLFSYLFGYAYNIVARNYALVELLMYCIAVIFPRRHGRHCLTYGILLALVANTHVYGALVVAALLAYDSIYLLGRDRATRRVRLYLHLKQVGAILLPVALGFVLLYATMSGPRFASMAKPNLGTFLSADLWAVAKNAVGYSFGSDNTSVLEILFHLSTSNPMLIFLLKFIDLNLIPAVAILLILGRFKPAFLSALFLLPFSALLVFSSSIAYRHVAIFAVVVVFAYWVSETTNEEFAAASTKWDAVVSLVHFRGISLAKFATVLVLVWSLLSFGLMAALEIGYPYSSGQELAQFIQKSGYDSTNTTIVTINPEQVSAALPFLKGIQSMFVPGWRDGVSYLPWDQGYYNFEVNRPDPFVYARSLQSQGRAILVVVSYQPKDVPQGFRCVFNSLPEPSVKMENYLVYVMDN